jgi:hypothetical protein
MVVVCSLSARANAAAPATDVKVCVLIEEKSWTEDGKRQAPPAAKAGSPAAQTKEPPPAILVEPQSAPPNVAAPAQGPEASAPDNSTPAPPATESGAEATSTHGSAPEKSPDDDGVSEDEAEFFVVNPVLYLKRLIEYHVTHEPGFESVKSGCSQTVTVELYPVKHGWTVFARYSGNGREEKVDVVRLDELGTFAERVTWNRQAQWPEASPSIRESSWASPAKSTAGRSASKRGGSRVFERTRARLTSIP